MAHQYIGPDGVLQEMPVENAVDEALWTVMDNDGVTHKAVRRVEGLSFVITLCPWWDTHNVAGETAPVRSDALVTCVRCVQLQLEQQPHG